MTSILLGTVTVNTTGLVARSYSLVVDQALDGFSSLSLGGISYPLGGIGNFTISSCGNGIVELGEACDDANIVNGDGCDNNCMVTGCGNGIVTAGEACDDGFRDACGSCNATCTAPGTPSTCGDRVVCPETEACDDGFTDVCGSCNATCTAPGTPSACGDGVVCPETEACDDANLVNGDGCENNCTITSCIGACDVHVALVATLTDPGTTSDVTTTLPSSRASVVKDTTYYLEVWASDVGNVNTGLTGVYVDVAFCSATSATVVNQGTIFTTFPSGSISPGSVDEFGGSALPHGGGIAPQWVRVGWLTMRADALLPNCSISLQPSATGLAAFTRGSIPWASIQLGSVGLAITATPPPGRRYDVDADGRIGLGDLSLFAGSWLQSIPPGNRLHDFDCDNFVGVGDLSWFATGWLKFVGDPSILDPPCAPPPLANVAGEVDVDFELVVLANPSTGDLSSSLPASIEAIAAGTTYYLEIWVSDAGSTNTGLTSAYVDVSVPSDAGTVQSISHGGVLTLLTSGQAVNDGINEFGGSVLPGGVGIEPQWVRVGYVRLQAETDLTLPTFFLSPSATGVAALGRGVIPWNDISLDSVTVRQCSVAPPAAETIVSAAGASVPSVKNRFLSFSGGEAGLQQAVRVRFADLPGAFDIYDGTTAWVALPAPVSELPGKGLSDPVGTDPTFMTARLSEVPVFADWSTFGVVHVYDERIIPSRKTGANPLEPSIYEIQIVTDGCDVGSEASFSPALTITNARWGDVASLQSGQFRAPDGSVDVTADVLAVLAKFSNAPGAPIKARAEMVGTGAGGPQAAITGKIDISDVLAVLGAFSGGSYPFPPPP